LNFTGNTLNTEVDIYNSNNLVLSNNNIKLDPSIKTFSAVLILSRSSSGTIANNSFDGGWPANLATWSSDHTGADDGILIDHVSNSVISGNTLSNNWDCGIE